MQCNELEKVLNSNNHNIYEALGVVKLFLQLKGIHIKKPINTDNTGIYIVIKDMNSNIQRAAYVMYSVHGIHINIKNNYQIGKYTFQIFTEPTYISFDEQFESYSFRDLVNLEYKGHLSVTALNFCIYVQENIACIFCGISNWRDSQSKSMTLKANAVIRAFENGDITHLSITTGVTPSKDEGIINIIHFLEKLPEQIRKVIPIFAEFSPPEDVRYLDILKRLGVQSVGVNIEFCDNNLRKRLMPGKGTISIAKYFNTWKYAVSLFGKNQVFTNVLISNYISNKEEERKLLKDIVKCGVIPSPGILYNDPYAKEQNHLPTLHQMIQMNEYIADLLVSNGLNPLIVYAGCQKNGAYSAINEFYQSKKLSH